MPAVSLVATLVATVLGFVGPDERLLAERQRRESIGVQLHHRRVVHALEQVPPLTAFSG